MHKPFKTSRMSAVLVAFALVGLMAAAQEKYAKGGKSGQTMTVTGCLQKGDEADEFSIAANGKTYGLRSRTVKLADHLGHKVSVTGNFKPEKDEAEKGKEAGDITVTSLKMISTSCS